MHRSFVALVTVLLLAIPAVAGAQAFSVVVEGFPSFPLSDKGIRGADEKLKVGIGGRAAALYHVTSWLKTGIGIGIVANRTDVVPSTFFPGSPSTVVAKATLRSIPIHAMIQPFYDVPDGNFGVFGDLGFGFVDASLQVEDFPQSGNISQADFSILVGGGARYAINETFALRLSLKYVQSFTKNGDVWASGSDPKALYLALGGEFDNDSDE